MIDPDDQNQNGYTPFAAYNGHSLIGDNQSRFAASTDAGHAGDGATRSNFRMRDPQAEARRADEEAQMAKLRPLIQQAVREEIENWMNANFRIIGTGVSGRVGQWTVTTSEQDVRRIIGSMSWSLDCDTKTITAN